MACPGNLIKAIAILRPVRVRPQDAVVGLGLTFAEQLNDRHAVGADRPSRIARRGVSSAPRPAGGDADHVAVDYRRALIPAALVKPLAQKSPAERTGH